MNWVQFFTQAGIVVLLLIGGSNTVMSQTKKTAPKKNTAPVHKATQKKSSNSTNKASVKKPATPQHKTANQSNSTHKNTTANSVHKTSNTVAKKSTITNKHSTSSSAKGKTAYKGKKKTNYKKKKRYPTKPYVPYNYQEKDITLRDTFLTKKNINLSAIQNQDLFNQIYQWYGVPYHYGGASKTGTDCAGFVKSVFKAIYNVDLARSATAQYPQCRQVVGEPHEGDLVFFNIRGRYLSHVGIYLQNGYFVHAATHSGVVISNLNEPYYKAYFYRFGAPPTVPGTFLAPINDSIPMHIEEPDSDSLDANH